MTPYVNAATPATGRMSSPRHLHSCTVLNSIFRKGIVGVAIEPALPGLSRRNYRMPALVRVFARVVIR